MHGNSKLIDFNTVNEEDYDLTGGKRYTTEDTQGVNEEDDHTKLKVANLPQSQRAYAAQLVLYFGGELIPCLMYSAKWNLREKGV